MFNKKKSISFIVFLVCIATFGQEIQEMLPIIPTSPQAEAFQRYGDMNINHSTGIPNISIPLHVIEHRGYKIPISLNYSPQPLRPGYNYDVFGQGWNLSLNSVISRTIVGAPDESNYFSLEDDYSDYYFLHPGSPITATTIANQYDLKTLNTAYDKFSAVLPDGSSFDFIFDDNVVKISNGRQVKITKTFTTNNITKFTVIDENGIKYTFDEGDHPRVGSAPFSNYTSWKLSRIDLPHSNQPITFLYEKSISSQHLTFSPEPAIKIEYGTESTPNPWGGGGSSLNIVANSIQSTSQTGISYQMKLLTRVTYGSKSIYLSYQDTSPSSYYNYIDNIKFFASSGVKTIDFDNTIYNIQAMGLSTPVSKLYNVTINGFENSSPSLSYELDYLKNSNYTFYGTDHWGYLNNHDTTYDVAFFNLFVPIDTDQHTNFLQSSRISKLTKSPQELTPYTKIKLCESYLNIDVRRPSSAADHGILKSISYPTKGFTEFEFENHRFMSSTDNSGNYISSQANRTIANAGGFRINKITDYTKIGEPAKVKIYKYGKRINGSDHTNVGVASVQPNVLTYMKYSAWNTYSQAQNPDFLRYMILGLDPYGNNNTSFSDHFDINGFYYTTKNWKIQLEFDAQNFRRLLNGRQSVYYPYVTEYHGEIKNQNYQYLPEKTIGKTTYHYDITHQMPNLKGEMMDSIFIESPFYNGHAIVYGPNKHRYNQLKEIKHYKREGQDFSPVKKIKYTYTGSVSDFSELTFNGRNPMPFTTQGHFNPNMTVGYLFIASPYRLGWSTISTETATTYYDSGKSSTTSKNYFYNDRGQVSEIRTENSEREIIKQQFTYPKINTSGGTDPIVAKMVNKNMIAPVLETQTIRRKENSSQEDLIAGSKITYDEFIIGQSNLLLPSETFQMEIDQSTTNYVSVAQIVKYSENGNPLESLMKGVINNSYYWGENDTQIIIEGTNISYSALSSAVIASLPQGFSSLDQLLNSFVTTSQDWKNFNISLRAAIPDDSRVSTFTYSKFDKVSSVTDPKNLTITYHYDSLGRLKEVRDHNGFLVQDNRMNYR